MNFRRVLCLALLLAGGGWRLAAESDAAQAMALARTVVAV